MAKIGDTVRYLNAVGGGVVKRIEGPMAYVDEDGFETPVLLRECVVVAAEHPTVFRQPASVPTAEPARKAAEPVEPAKPAAAAAPDPDDTPEGEKLNIVLAFEPEHPKQLTTTDFDAYIVNDSNYALYVVYLTRADGDREWTLRFAEPVEAHMQVPVQHVVREDLAAMDRVCVQLLAYKPAGRTFRLKSPIAVECALDTSKFFKLHCFRDNPYFDTPVIAVDLVRDDAPVRPLAVEAVRLEEGMRSRRRDAERPQARRVVRNDKPGAPSRHAPGKPSPAAADDGPLVVDLHISELLDTTAGLNAADIFEVQMREFRRVMEENVAAKGRKVVFIHGKGEGVLRKEILKELNYKYKSCEVQDASFREYGFGATQVTMR